VASLVAAPRMLLAPLAQRVERRRCRRRGRRVRLLLQVAAGHVAPRGLQVRRDGGAGHHAALPDVRLDHLAVALRVAAHAVSAHAHLVQTRPATTQTTLS